MPFLPRFATVAIFTCAAAGSVEREAAISRCEDDAGRLHFLQFGCPPGTRNIAPESEHQALLSVVTTAPLSAEERQALKQLERSLARDRQARATRRAQNARQQAARREENARRCDEANRKLAELAERRRKGYPATAERRLEAEESRWRAARKAAC
jgi:hypothetical protein